MTTTRAPDAVPISRGPADSGTTAPWTAKNLIRKRNRPQGSEYYDDDDGDDDDDDDDDDAGARRGSNFAEPRGFWNHARPAALPPLPWPDRGLELLRNGPRPRNGLTALTTTMTTTTLKPNPPTLTLNPNPKP